MIDLGIAAIVMGLIFLVGFRSYARQQKHLEESKKRLRELEVKMGRHSRG